MAMRGSMLGPTVLTARKDAAGVRREGGERQRASGGGWGNREGGGRGKGNETSLPLLARPK